METDGWGVYAIWIGPYDCLYIGKSADGESVKTRLLAHLSPQERNSNRRLYNALYLNRDHVEFAVCLTDSPEWGHRIGRPPDQALPARVQHPTKVRRPTWTRNLG